MALGFLRLFQPLQPTPGASEQAPLTAASWLPSRMPFLLLSPPPLLPSCALALSSGGWGAAPPPLLHFRCEERVRWLFAPPGGSLEHSAALRWSGGGVGGGGAGEGMGGGGGRLSAALTRRR